MQISRKIAFRLGDPVILRAKPETLRIITGYILRDKSVVYGLSDGENESWHQDYEIEPTAKAPKIKGFKG